MLPYCVNLFFTKRCISIDDKIPAVAYCRVSKVIKENKENKENSTRDQKNSYEAQIRFFREKAEELGYYLVKGIGTFGDGVFADRGISGRSLKKRDEFNKMIELSKTHQFKTILVTNASRFARNAVDGMDEIRKLKINDVYIYFIKENLKSCNHSDEFLIDFFLVFAQNELRETSKKIQDGMRKAQFLGKWTSFPPYGYDRVKGFLVINEKESTIVKIIFNMYINGISLNKIAQYLNNNNIKTKKNFEWNSTGLRNIIKNPIYKGLQINHQVEMKDVFIDLKEKVDEEDRIIHQNNELIIIDEETFNKAQEILRERANLYNQGKKYSTVNILSNLFYCGNCGATMKRFERTDNHKSFYLCRAYHSNKTCKFSNYAREDKTIEYIINQIKNFEFNWNSSDGGPESIKEIYEQYINNNLYDELVDNLPSIEEKISKLLNRKNNLIDMRADGEISKEEYKQRRNQIEIELEPLLREKKKIDNIIQEREKVWKIYNQFCKYIKEFDIDNINNLELRKIIKKIIIKTENKERKIFIEWNSGLDKDFGQILEEFIDNKMIDTYSTEEFHETYDFDK